LNQIQTAAIILDFFKPVDEFEEKYKPSYSGQIKNYCKHNFFFKIVSQYLLLLKPKDEKTFPLFAVFGYLIV